jgi:recombination protein RecT
MSNESLKQAIAKREETNAFPALLENFKTEVANALPEHLRVNMPRYLRLALSEFRNNPKLSECDPRSVFAAVIRASQLGLELGVLGQAYLVPYGNQAQMIPGWKGYVTLIHRSERAVVWTGIINEDQKYEYRDGSQKSLKVLNESTLMEDRDITHAFAVGIVKGMESFPIIELWPVAKILRHRDRFNKVGKRHYSFENFEQYARKVPLLQVVKYLPASVELSSLIAMEYAAESGAQPQGYTIDAIQEGLFTPAEPVKNAPEGQETQKTAHVEAKSEPIKETQKSAEKTGVTKAETKKVESGTPPFLEKEEKPKAEKTETPKTPAKAAAAIPPVSKGLVKRGVEFPARLTVESDEERYTDEQLETANAICKDLKIEADTSIKKWLKVERKDLTFEAMAKFIELLEVLKK